jgi:phosphoglycerate dehydrogenase-like enzyme
MATPHVLVAVDLFEERHLERIAGAVEGWASWESIGHPAPAPIYEKGLARAELMMGWPDPKPLARSPVRLLQLPSVGYDDYAGCGLERKPGFVLCNARGVMSVQVAEHGIALMLALTRRIADHVGDQRERRWRRRSSYLEVAGTTACIVGLGSIGTQLARRCAGLGMEVVGVRGGPHKLHPVVKRMYGLWDLRDAVAQANHVFSVLPAAPETDEIFDSAIFDAMRPGSFFYNLSRGSVVDEPALVERLLSGRLGGVGLDVVAVEPLPPHSSLWGLDNVVITPHVGGRSVHEADRLCDLFLRNLDAYRDGRPLTNVVLGGAA